MYIVGSIVVVIIIAVIFCVLAVLAKHILMFNSVPCPECDSYMQYRGEKLSTSFNVLSVMLSRRFLSRTLVLAFMT